ncbi:hypothetical protein PoB_005763900 [Plakobranchus ocellatus]|uniref:Uncharacterized protein n=1 Tax=Plakobranchus ocellatus TaxID=259542 RepID=A0AAV4CJ28_9GAST|nr:hypothetical protein PoB_005763900 [Plakobranchus ocellatus]
MTHNTENSLERGQPPLNLGTVCYVNNQASQAWHFCTYPLLPPVVRPADGCNHDGGGLESRTRLFMYVRKTGEALETLGEIKQAYQHSIRETGR